MIELIEDHVYDNFGESPLYNCGLIERYTMGNCWELAVILEEETGLPMLACGEFQPKDEYVIERDCDYDDLEDSWGLHVVNLVDDKHVVDITGKMHIDECTEKYHYISNYIRADREVIENYWNYSYWNKQVTRSISKFIAAHI